MVSCSRSSIASSHGLLIAINLRSADGLILINFLTCVIVHICSICFKYFQIIPYLTWCFELFSDMNIYIYIYIIYIWCLSRANKCKCFWWFWMWVAVGCPEGRVWYWQILWLCRAGALARGKKSSQTLMHWYMFYSIIVNSPARSKILRLVGGTSRESRPNMRLLAVDQLRKIENDALEVNVASFSLCLHWWTCFFVMPGSFMWPSSKSSHVFTCRPAGGGAFLE